MEEMIQNLQPIQSNNFLLAMGSYKALQNSRENAKLLNRMKNTNTKGLDTKWLAQELE